MAVVKESFATPTLYTGLFFLQELLLNSTANAFASQHQAPVSGSAHRRPCHRGPAAKAKSRARAATHQAAEAAAAAAPVSSSQQDEPESSLASPAPG